MITIRPCGVQCHGFVERVLVRVEAPHFVAGIELEADICVQAAPILRRLCLGRRADVLRALFRRKGWRASVIR